LDHEEVESRALAGGVAARRREGDGGEGGGGLGGGGKGGDGVGGGGEGGGVEGGGGEGGDGEAVVVRAAVRQWRRGG